MELKLDDAKQQNNSVITRMVVHNQEEKAMFSLEYDPVTDSLQFYSRETDEIIDHLIRSKSTLTTEKGVEAFGTFVAGASNNVPMYKHLLTLYIPQGLSNFDKYHLTLETSLEHINLQRSLLLSAECYAILYDPLVQFLETGSISLDDFPLLLSFFRRKYSFEAMNLLMRETDLDGTPLENDKIIQAMTDLSDVLDHSKDFIHSADLFIMSVSGAIVAHSQFLKHNLQDTAIDHISHGVVSSPGIFSSTGMTTLWFPFTKNKVGKINRAISTTLNTLNYASTNRNIQDQVQTNIAHKFHDLVDIVATEVNHQNSSFGLQTNVGFLVCSLAFHESYHNDIDTILRISHVISNKVKVYGQSLLGHIARHKQFEPVID